jgi:plastocyanin
MRESFNRLTLLILFSLMAAGVSESAEPMKLKTSEDGVQRAEIVLDTYSFNPDHLIVTVGRPVELTLKSVTIIVPHNFVIKAPEIGVEIHQEVPAGRTVKIQFTPTQTGKVEIFCDKKLLFFKSHKERGMIGTLEVINADDDSPSVAN